MIVHFHHLKIPKQNRYFFIKYEIFYRENKINKETPYSNGSGDMDVS